MDQEEIPVELNEENFVIEYDMSTDKPEKSNFVFLIDTCVSQTNFQAMKKALVEVSERINFEKNRVCVVTFNRNVYFYKNTKKENFVHNIVLPPFIPKEKRSKLLGVKREKMKVLN